MGNKFRLPAGAFTGAFVGVGCALGLYGFPRIDLPDFFGWAIQVLVGVIVGLRVSRDSLSSGAKALFPAATLTALFLASSLVAALSAVWLTGISPTTAIFAAAPGGLTEMATIGITQGANGPAVAAVHVSRLLIVIFVVGFLVSRLNDGSTGKTSKTHSADDPGPSRGTLRLAAISAAGLVGGIAGLLLTPLAAGGVVGSLLGAGAARLCLRGGVPEKGFQISVQGLAGGVIGLGLSAEFFQTLAQLAGAALLINAVQMSVWLAAYYLLAKAVGYDIQTATFASAPGGMGATLSMLGDTSADIVTVAFVHLLRVIATVVSVPLIVAAFIQG